MRPVGLLPREQNPSKQGRVLLLVLLALFVALSSSPSHAAQPLPFRPPPPPLDSLPAPPMVRQIPLLSLRVQSLTRTFLETLDPGKEEEALFALALETREAQNFEEAEALLREFLRRYPHSPLRGKALFLLGELLSLKGDYEAADSLYGEAQKLLPAETSRQALAQRVNLALTIRDLPRAAYLLRQLLREEPDPMRAKAERRVLARILAHLGKPNEALTLLPPEDRESLLAAHLYLLARDFPSAARLYEKHEAQPGVRFLLGYARWKAGDLEGALQAWSRVPPEDPLFDWAALYRGTTLSRRGACDEALPVLNTVRDSLLRPYALTEAGRCAFLLGKLQEAEEALTRAVAENPLPWAFLILGQLYGAKGAFSKALQTLERAATFPNLETYARLQIAFLLYRTGKAKEALKTLRKLPELPDSLSPYAQLLEAKALLRVGRDAEGLSRLTTLFADRRVGPYAALEAGLYFYTHNLFDRALDPLEKALESPSPPVRRAALLYLADALFNLHRYPEAAEYYTRYLSEAPPTDPNHPSTLWALGLAQFRAGELTDAERHFDELARAVPGTPLAYAALYMKALCLDGQGQPEKAAALLRAIADSAANPTRDRAFLEAANVLYNADRLAEAQSLYRAFLDRFPESAYLDEALEGLFYVGQRQNNPQAVLRFLDTKLQERPDLAPLLLYKKGEFLLNLGRTEEGIEALETFLQRFPQHPLAPRARLQIGLAYVRNGKPQNALLYLKDAQENEEGAFRYGQVLYTLGHHETAEEVLKRFLVRYPRSPFRPEALYTLGLTLEAQGKEGEAIEEFQTLLLEYPTNPLADRVILELAPLLGKRGLVDSALVLLDALQARRSDALAGQAELLRGDLYRMQGDCQRAVEAYMRAYRVYEAFRDISGEGLFRAGECYERLGRKEEALVVYKRLLHDFPDSPHREEAESHIQALEKALLEEEKERLQKP